MTLITRHIISGPTAIFALILASACTPTGVPTIAPAPAASNAGSGALSCPSIGPNIGQCIDFDQLSGTQNPAEKYGPAFSYLTHRGSAAVVDAHGRRALRLFTEATGNSPYVGAFLEIKPSGPATNASGHMLVYVEATPTTNVHWTMVEGRGKRASDGHTANMRFGGQHPVATGSRLMNNYDTPDGYYPRNEALLSDCWHHGDEDLVMPVGRWVEIGWRMGQQNHQIDVSIDGRWQNSLSVASHGQGCLFKPGDYRWEVPVIEAIHLGWESYQPDEARTIYIDNVVINAPQ